MMDSRKTGVQRVEHYIREQVATGVLKEGQQIASEWELSRKFKISRSSVHQAFEILTKDKIFYRIPGKGTFVSFNISCKEKIKGKKIGFVFPDIHLPEGSNDAWFNSRDIFLGVLQEARLYGAEVHIEVCRPDITRKEFSGWLHNHLYNNSFEGLVFQNVSGYELLMEELVKNRIPVAAWEFNSQPYDTVAIDYKQGMFDGVSFLLEEGKRSIIYLGHGYKGWGAEDKFDSYSRALKEYGISVQEKMLIPFESSPHFGFAAVSKAIRSGLDFDAIVANNDIMAVDAIYALRENGLRVPDDVAVLGSDDMPGMDTFQPPLATLRVPRIQSGKHLFQMVKNRILEPDAPIVKVTLKAPFILRDSAKKGSFCKAKDKTEVSA